MKWLKIYEEYNDNLYHNISLDEWSKYRSEPKWDEFNNTEILKISEIDNKIRFGSKDKSMIIKNNKGSIWLYIQAVDFWKHDEDPSITIDKIIDDYFLIRDLRCYPGGNIKFFKADTINGVIQYLIDFSNKELKFFSN